MQSIFEYFSNKSNVTVIEDDVIEQFKNLTVLSQRIATGVTTGPVLVVASEINPAIEKAIRTLDQPGVTWFIPGYINNCDAKTISYQWHIWHVCLYNRSMSVDYTNSKPYYFDALLGSRRLHRTFVYNKIQNTLADKCITRYHGIQRSNKPLNDNNHFIWPRTDSIPDLDVMGNPITATTTNVIHNGESVRLSCIVPEDVYNQSAYSVVTETYYDNGYSFFTEKVAKPIMARRLFVVFSGYKYLENLRRLGFQTFGHVIDEGYDQIIDNDERFAQAFEQMSWLCNQDQEIILNKIQSICEHNYNILMSTDWSQNFLS